MNLKKHWFQFVSIFALMLFLSIMVIVTYIAFSRSSGVTSLDMSTIQNIRYQAQFSNK